MAQDGKNKRHFFKEFKAELKKVIWPTPKQIINGTIAVITIVLITAVIVFALDTAFNLLNEQGTLGIKKVIEDKQENEIKDNETEDDLENDLLFEIPEDGDGSDEEEFDTEEDTE